MRDVAITDRRRLLKRTTLFFAGVAGLGLAGKTGVEAAPAMPIQDTALTMELHGVNWRLVYPDRPRGVLPMRGQRSSSFGELLRGPGKEKVGEFYASSFQFGRPFGQSEVAAGALETHHFNFIDGTIVGIGTLSDLDGSESVHAIIGGTGRYEGATGSYRASQHPVEMGGDGSANFTFNIILRSA